MNAPPAFETFLLYDGEKKLKVEVDTKVPNAASFKFAKEDHTIGNILRSQLLRDPKVLFAGYKIAHPLEYEFVLRIQTTDDYSPAQALQNCLTDLISEVSLLHERFTSAIKEKKAGIE